MRYDIFDSNESVVVPVGFVTDFASAPQALWSFGLSPHGRYSRAAVIHDFLYWAQICTREQADNIMLLAMMESGVNSKEQFLFYRGVDFGGNPSWKENKDDRAKGLPRVVPVQYRYNIPHNATWDEWEQVLVRNNVKDPIFPTTAGYCRLGTDEYVAQKMKDMEEECKMGLNPSFCL
ncbi:MAG: DUF1353 domain-containing protein [Gammaproteobacteria bacterium]|nr:DUF1353 domain-containing protein [Gammaproteobacteria bacterium]